jgi:hypothetical protein
MCYEGIAESFENLKYVKPFYKGIASFVLEVFSIRGGGGGGFEN